MKEDGNSNVQSGVNVFVDNWYRMNVLIRSLSQKCYKTNGKNNKEALTSQQYGVLRIISELGDDSFLREIASKNCVSKAALSIMLSKLEKQGLVKKEDKIQKDKRMAKVILTRKGKNELAKQGERILTGIGIDALNQLEKKI